MRRMNGGLLLNETHESKTIENAIEFFKTNSTFSILTNSSSACITFKATLNEEFWDDSPFIHIRSGIIELPVRTLLFKYFPVNPSRNAESELVSFYTCNPRGGGKTFIELSQEAEIKREYDIQLLLYETTYNTMSSAYEPVCPYPIHCSTDLDKEDTIQEIIEQLDKSNKEKIEKDIFIITDTLCGDLNELIEEESEDESHFTIYDKTTKKEVTRDPEHPILGEDIVGGEARTKIKTLGCIVMEFMDGFITLNEYLKTTTNENDINKSKSLAAYEVVRLKQIGFIHGDLFLDNIMYNPEYNYITNKVDKDKHDEDKHDEDKHDEDKHDEDNYKGRALLIDFGQSSIDFKALEEEEKAFYLKYDEHTDVYERKEKYLRFYPPYTFEEIYRRRLEVTLTFRKTMIKGLETMLDKFNKLTTEEEKTKFIQDKKIQLKLGLITNSKYPTNFVNPNDDSFDRIEFNEPFQDLKTKILNGFNKEFKVFTKDHNVIKALIKLKEPESESTKKLESKATKAFNRLEYLTKKFINLFSPSQSVHVGGRYITSHKTHNDFANRLDRRIRTTLRIKRRQTKRRKRGKRSKKGKRKKQTKRKKINN